MNGNIIPLFYDQSSFKSILTFEAKEGTTGPRSIVALCKENGIKNCVAISKNFSTFLDAWKNLKAIDVKLIWGIEFTFCDDAKTHTDESRNNEHKVIIFMKDKNGYEDLLKIYTACHANPENKYYVQRFDFKQLKPLWTDNLILALPFFDSFIARNLLTYNSAIVPDFSFAKPIIFREVGSNLPFEHLIHGAVDRYVKDAGLETFDAKTIYYKERADFRAYSVYRAIMNKELHSKPNLEHFGSQEFCWENYKELIK